MTMVMNVTNICSNGWMNAIRGMRNSRQSWEKMDSKFEDKIELGPNDLKLASSLAKLGGSHAKFRRMIHVSMDVTAPLYWWKEFDTYKVGTTANSTSTMYSITNKKFEIDDFATDGFLSATGGLGMINIIDTLNQLRDKYFDENNVLVKHTYWREIIQLLPESYKQMRTIDCNYEVLSHIVKERKHHKLREWKIFISRFKDLPYSKELIFCDDKPDKPSLEEQPELPGIESIDNNNFV